MKGQMRMKAKYGQACSIAYEGVGERRRKKHLDRRATGEGDLPLSMAVGEGTTTAICGDTAGIARVSAPPAQEAGKGVSSFPSLP